jgi:lysyl-tRNA synthetase, class II
MGEPIPKERLAKLEQFRAEGGDPYPKRFPVRPAPRSEREFIAPLRERYVEGAELPTSICGRVTAFRDHGNSFFLDLKDETAKVQVYVQKNKVGEATFAQLLKTLDLNDWLGVQGKLAKTRKGELTVFADSAILLAKSLRHPPAKWEGLSDVEIRFRHRHMDLAVNDEVVAGFRARSRIVAEIRRFLDGKGFMEVEGPLLHHIAGGAAARPFFTHHNALDIGLTLRIALELHLKRLLCGGLERVYEIGRVFRNEGIDATHNPEFTMLELYWAFADYEDVMDLWEEMLAHLSTTVRGSTKITWDGTELDLTPPFRRVRYADLLKEKSGVDLDDEAAVRRRCEELKIDHRGKSHHKAANDLFEHYCEESLIQPTFVTEYPRGITPLAKWTEYGSDKAERFELFINGVEIANSFSEMNDPLEQRRILEAQVREKDDENPSAVDEEFLAALEYGMPPAGGVGMGIDRLVMMLTDRKNIREVVLFPLLRPYAEALAAEASQASGAGAPPAEG